MGQAAGRDAHRERLRRDLFLDRRLCQEHDPQGRRAPQGPGARRPSRPALLLSVLTLPNPFHCAQLTSRDLLSPNNDVKLATVKESPVLQREGIAQNEFEKSGNPVPTMEEWTFAKQKWQRTYGAVRGDPKFETAQILPGWNEKIYDPVPAPAIQTAA